MALNKGLTVKQLLQACQRQVAKGNGDKYIIISSDDEGNSFHTLFYEFTDDKKDIEYYLNLEQDRSHTVDDTVALG